MDCLILEWDHLKTIRMDDILSHPIPSLVSLANNLSSKSSNNFLCYVLFLSYVLTMSNNPKLSSTYLSQMPSQPMRMN